MLSLKPKALSENEKAHTVIKLKTEKQNEKTTLFLFFQS